MSETRNPVGWFEIPVTDIERATAFYEKVFGFTLEFHEMGGSRMAWFPMHEDGPAATGSLVESEGYAPSTDGVIIYFTAPDINAHLDRVRENGGQVLTEKTNIGEYGFFGLVRDTEGNRIGLHSRVG